MINKFNIKSKAVLENSSHPKLVTEVPKESTLLLHSISWWVLKLYKWLVSAF